MLLEVVSRQSSNMAIVVAMNLDFDNAYAVAIDGWGESERGSKELYCAC